MSGDSQRRRQELAAAAEEVFDALLPEDLRELLAGYSGRAALRDDVVEQAEKVARKLAKTADPVRPPEEDHLVAAACLTRGRTRAGVAQNTNNAAKKFAHYRRFPKLPVGYLVRTDRIVPGDEWTFALLDRSLRVLAGVTDARPDQEPELILNMVVPAIVAALGPGPKQPSAPGPDDALVGTAIEVLDRGAGLTAAYRVARRGVPTGAALPVTGNADFLIRIAAYRLAILERRGQVVPEPLDELAREVAELAHVLGGAMKHSAGWWNRRGPDEPDVAIAFARFASYLGSVRGDDTVRRAVGAAHSVLSYRLGLGEPPREIAVDDPGARRPPGQPGADRFDVEHLVGWLVAALFAEAGPDDRQCLLQWLDGKTVPDEPKNLPLLVRRMRIATRTLDDAPAGSPPLPAGVTGNRYTALTARLAAAVDLGRMTGEPKNDARHVTYSVLPPLWTRREPAVHLVRAHLRILLGRRDKAESNAALVATHGVRAPVQFVQQTTSPLPDPCCAEATSRGRPAPVGRPREPAPYDTICTHRPWGEVGWVENYRSLGDAAGCGADTARKRLTRYPGPWPELLWH